MKDIIVKGVIPALITPMIDNVIDYKAFKRILQAQLDAKVSAVVLFGTTGEPLSLMPDEKTKIFYIARDLVGDRIPIICGISSPITDFAVKSAECLSKLGADGLLVVTPYYYTCTSQGLLEHYNKISEATDLPIIVYNVPARTGVDLTVDYELIKKIFKIKKIYAIKNAAKTKKSNLDFLSVSDIPVYCGNDSMNLESLIKGSYGSISVLSNLFPELETAMHNAFFSHSNTEKYFDEFLQKICDAFSEIPNPIAIKYACSIRYGFKPHYRLPLTAPSDYQIEKIKKVTFEVLKEAEKLL